MRSLLMWVVETTQTEIQAPHVTHYSLQQIVSTMITLNVDMDRWSSA